jgi:hypothetical protein
MSSDRLSSSIPLTIIPQRKHRKLLKDGSGTEVWPEAVEQVFVQGTTFIAVFLKIKMPDLHIQVFETTGILPMPFTLSRGAVAGGAINSSSTIYTNRASNDQRNK